MNPIVTVDELSGYLQRDIDRYSANIAVRGASGVVRHYCGWNLSRAVETLYVDGKGSTSLSLPTMKLNDVTAVYVDGAALGADEYSWGTNGVLVKASGWPTGPRRISADVDHGYDPLPDELSIVVNAIAARLYSNPEGLTAKSSGDNSRTFGAVLSELEMRLISGYRL